MNATAAATIVLADDELIRIAYRDGLVRAGYDIQAAADGESALALIKKHHPKLVLLDLIMPKLSGFEVLKKLKADPDVRDIPVAVLSNLSKTTDENEVRSLGAVDFIVKSDHSLKELVERVSNWVKQP